MPVISASLGEIDTVSWGGGDDLIVLLHASATGPHAFAGLAGQLASTGRQLLAPAFVGYGATRLADTAPSDHTARNLAIANHVLATAGGGKRIVVGHSMGGLIALLCAIDQAERGRPLDALILYEPILHDMLDPAAPDEAAALAWDRNIITAMVRDVRAGRAEQGIRRFVEVWNDVAWHDLPRAARVNLVANAANLVRETTAMPAARLRPDRLRRLPTPTLLLAGDRSPAFIQLVLARLAAQLPGARSVTLPGLGHMAPIARPDGVATAIEGLLAELPETAA